MSNPYEVVGSPSYAGPMMNWFGNQQQQGNRQPQQQQQASAPGAPQQPQPGQPGTPPGGQPNQAQQQMQGLGGYLQKLFGGGQQQGGAPGGQQGQTLYPQGAMGPNQPSNPYQNNGY